MTESEAVAQLLLDILALGNVAGNYSCVLVTSAGSHFVVANN